MITLATGANQQSTGYAVGTVNGALIWQVNGVTGGGSANGTVSTAGFYTAPAHVPMGGPMVTVTAVSAAQTRASAPAIVTIQ